MQSVQWLSYFALSFIQNASTDRINSHFKPLLLLLTADQFEISQGVVLYCLEETNKKEL